MDNDEATEAQVDSAADSTLESEIDALSKILEDDQSGPVDDNVGASFDDFDDTGNDNDFFSLIEEEKSLKVSESDEREKKSDEDEEKKVNEKVSEEPEVCPESRNEKQQETNENEEVELENVGKDDVDRASVLETSELECLPVENSKEEDKILVSEEEKKLEFLEIPKEEIKKIEDIKMKQSEENEKTDEIIEEKHVEKIDEKIDELSSDILETKNVNIIEMGKLELTEDEKSPEPAELEENVEMSESRLDEENTTLMEHYVSTVESSELRLISPAEEKTDDEVFHTPPQSVHEDELKESEDKKEEGDKFENEDQDRDITLTYEEDEEGKSEDKNSSEDVLNETQSFEEKTVLEAEVEKEESSSVGESRPEEVNISEEKVSEEAEPIEEEMKLVAERESEADSELEDKSEEPEPTVESELKEKTVVEHSEEEVMEIDCSLDEVAQQPQIQEAEETVEKSDKEKVQEIHEKIVINAEEPLEEVEQVSKIIPEFSEQAAETSEKVEDDFAKVVESSDKVEETAMKMDDDSNIKLVDEIEEEKMETEEEAMEVSEEIPVAVEKELDPEESEKETNLSLEMVPHEQLETEKEDEGPDLDLTIEPESEIDQVDDEALTATENIPKDPIHADSELEFAVKFLQDAEEQSIEADTVIVQKEPSEQPESSEMSDLFVSVQNTVCENTPEMEPELEESTPDPIAISEAEIISEAAKLESEKKAKLDEEKQIQENEASTIFEEERMEFLASDGLLAVARHDCPPMKIPVETPKAPAIISKPSENVPQISVLEERLKEPPQIEIPNSSCDILSLTPKSSLLIPRDAKGSNTPQKSLDSPRKEDGDNVGSPRIILKIAKSALADCSEPRSPKSPKIRSATNSPNPEDSPGQKLGKIKLKLSKGGHPSIISNDNVEESAPTQWHAEGSTSSLSPLGVKIKISKSRDESVVQPDKSYDFVEDREKHKIDEGKKSDAPSTMGMKIKLSKSGDASVVQSDVKEDDHRKNETPIGMKIKLSKSGDAEIIHDKPEETAKRTESPIGMKIKLSKYGDPSIVQSEDHKKDDIPKRTESPIGMKIKLSKTGDASIIEDSIPKENELKRTESPIGMKFKLSKSGDASIVHPDKSEYLEESKKERDIPKRTESPIGMKIKLSKTGDASIIPQDSNDDVQRDRHEEPVKLKLKTMTPDREISKKDRSEMRERRHKSKEPEGSLEMKIKLSKSGHATIVHNESLKEEKESEDEDQNRGIRKMMDPLQMMKQDLGSKRKELTISAVDPKKSKMEVKLSHIPEIRIQDAHVSIDHSNQLSHNISITNVRSVADDMSLQETLQTGDSSMSEKLKSLLVKHSMPSPSGSDCEIIEHRPELILVNENSNSSQDVMIIDEVPVLKPLEIKVPKKRGRPRRNPLPDVGPVGHMQLAMRDPLALDDLPGHSGADGKDSERPRRTCRSQKSYAPPKRGRGRGGGRGRGKRKMDGMAMISPNKRSRIDQDLTLIEERTTGIITLDDTDKQKELMPIEGIEIIGTKMPTPKRSKLAAKAARALQRKAMQEQKLELRRAEEAAKDEANKHPNWLTPLSKKMPDKESSGISSVVMDEETRMSAESGSRSQTPARNLAAPGVSENILNEESQGSVLSTATTESEKVKVKNRRMEINFDPDEGPFTVDKIAEYEWPQDRKGETFMIQEQISQYLGVKSFKRKYPDLKRRMVDMEERNFLRENGLVSEAMCDMGMGLTAICSSEVLDVMCSDFPEQYEEYRKQMRERQVKEHSKKQKELSAAANAERNRIDLAEMAVQSALSWNATFNKSRKDTRKASLDLQTFTIHVPQKKPVKIDPNRKISYYPVALIPGQYTDYYREYTPAELRYYPLNTVLYGPMKPNERKFDSQSEGSQSDSDSESSSDDSSSTSSEGTQDTEESQSTMEEVDMELAVYKEDSKNVKCKMCLKYLNKYNKTEVLIQCGTCNGFVHPSCIDLTLDMVPHLQAYAWQCTDCKTCAQCHDPADEDKMLFCDMCDRGYHIYCVGLRRVPQGRWHCQECAVCANCGTKEPAGINADRNSVAQWQHEYKKGDKNIRVYVSTLCVPCSKLWRKGRYCTHCSRCHTAQRLDLETNLVHCSACDKYLHLDCVEIKSGHLDRKNFLCDFCSPSRNSMPKSMLSKTVKSY